MTALTTEQNKATKVAALEDRIASLEEALDSGARSIMHDGKQIVYRSRTDMLATLHRLVSKHKRLNGVAQRPSIKRWRFQSGI